MSAVKLIHALLVEDSPTDELLTTQALEPIGLIRLTTCERLSEAMRLLHESPFDLVLLDLGLPDSQGLETLRKLRKEHSKIAIVVLTGTDDEELAVRALQEGAHDYIVKSQPNADLRRTIRYALERMQAADRLRESEERFRMLVEGVKDHAIMMLDAAGHVRTWNSGAEQLMGYTSEEILGEHFSRFFCHEDIARDVPRAELEDAIATGSHQAEGWRVRKDGTQYWCNSSVTALYHESGAVRAFAKLSRNLTERKLTDEKLRASERLFHQLADAMPQIVWMAQANGDIEYYNEQWYEYTGVARGIQEDESWSSVLHPEDLERFTDSWQQTVQSERPAQIECRFREQASGAYRWHLTRCVPQRDESGRVERWIGTSTDINELKRTEHELQRRTQLAELSSEIASTFASIGALRGILQRCAESMVAQTDAAFARIWTLDESAGVLELQASAGMYTHLDGPHSRIPLGENKIGRIAEQGKPHLTNTIVGDPQVNDQDWVRREGMVAFAGYPLLAAGRVVGVMAVFARRRLGGLVQNTMAGIADVMAVGIERFQAEEDLRLRDRAIQAVALGILITDPNQPDNPIIYASPGFQRLTGYAPAEVVGRNCRFLQGKDSSQASIAQLREAVRSRSGCVVEIVNYRKDGSAFWNSVAISPVFDDDGQVTHLVGVQSDVTQRRQLEEQLRQAQKMEAIGSLAGGVAHDFNNLLTIINGYSEMIQAQLPTDSLLRDLAGEVIEAGERAASLTRQLLAFSRKQVLEPKVINLNDTVTDTSRMLRRLIGEDIDLETQMDLTLGHVRADPGQLEQVLINLAVNARDAMPRGGRMTIETKRVQLNSADTTGYPELTAGNYSMVAVSDQGCGMDEATKDRVFEPFFTTKESGKGTGLGLATVYGIVKQSDGHIAVESEPGHGTTFRIYLPAVSTGVVEPVAQRDPQQRPTGTETILVVEDESAVRSLVRQILQLSGYTILEASCGDAAVKLVAEYSETIHLLVTDVVMPAMSGRQLAEQIRAIRPNVTVLYLSGYTDDAVVRHGVLQAESAFLQKPFSPSALLRKVRELLD